MKLHSVFKKSVMCMVLQHVYVPQVCPVPPKATRGVRFFGTDIIGSSKSPRGCQDPNSGPLHEQPVVLTAEPSLWPSSSSFGLPFPRDNRWSASFLVPAGHCHVPALEKCQFKS